MSASFYRRSENVRVFPVVIAELELGKIKLCNPLYGVQSIEGGGTPEMIEAGVSALYHEMGYQLLGSPGAGVEAVFKAMFRSSLMGVQQPSASDPAMR